MKEPKSNIEAVARDICSRQLSRFGCAGEKLATEVNRYWHCVAAQLESGQIDEIGEDLIPFDLEKSLEAYRDWCRRHPESKAG